MKLPLARAAELIEASGTFNPEGVAIGYSIDSRTVEPGELFFAVLGERLDGHDFVDHAFAKGAIAAVVRRDRVARYPVNSPLLAVDDPLLALQQLSEAVRLIWGKPLIGVTGSAGKTTTKEIIAHVLATRHNVLKSHGNLNNQFG
ncbi:MAG TPA: Mur ligase domain-containing protein, partial [Terriglobales bacterium]